VLVSPSIFILKLKQNKKRNRFVKISIVKSNWAEQFFYKRAGKNFHIFVNGIIYVKSLTPTGPYYPQTRGVTHVTHIIFVNSVL